MGLPEDTSSLGSHSLFSMWGTRLEGEDDKVLALQFEAKSLPETWKGL